jgi:hypothetical protein
MNIEIWKDVIGFETLYKISNRGRVKSIKRNIIRKMKVTKDGYIRVTLCNRKVNKTILVHHLVAVAFIGPIPADKEVNHKNRIRHDNRPENLEYLTPAENAAASNPFRQRGEKHYKAVLNEQKVREIRKDKGKMTIKAAAIKHNTKQSNIFNVWHNKFWRHVI